MDFDKHITEVKYEDSALGKIEQRHARNAEMQIEELRRIADAAQRQAELAIRRAIELEAEAKKAKREKIISIIFSTLSFASTVLMWLFTREDLLTLIFG